MDRDEAVKDIVCAMIASGAYTYKEENGADWQTALNIGWNVVWHGKVVDHATALLERIEESLEDEKELAVSSTGDKKKKG